MALLKFSKMQGAGNDFVFVNTLKGRFSLNRAQIRQVCHRQLGVGCDQLLVLMKSKKADFKMKIFNSDGSEAEMCGNGLRALVRYVQEKKISVKKVLKIETKNSVHEAKIISKNRIRVDMGAPALKGKEIPVTLRGRVINRPFKIEGKEFRITCIGMGNPHCVIFVDDVMNFPVEVFGPLIEKHSTFPRKANVEFVQIKDKNHVVARVWERGAGETLACGSGACAISVASVLNGFTERKLDVKLKGGTLELEWDRDTGHVFMTGPAQSIFEGEIKV
jgi:diaminopimelate epimerase